MNGPPMLALYRGATVALAPFAKLYLERRSRAGKEDSARLEERFGRAARARPAGALIWLHAASVGESGVALQIVEALREALPEAHFLITTGTRTSADLVSKRALAHTTHAYVPLDTIDGARAFLAHWRPDLGVFVESEIWPNLLLEAKAAGVKLALVNARMSSATLQRWSSWRDSGRALFSAFDLITAADARTAEGLADILGRDVRCAGNLKLAATAPKVDLAARAEVLAQIDRRTVWLGASTHAGEDEILLDAHARLRDRFTDALLILVPRHPDRGAQIAALANGAPRRSLGAGVGTGSVYVADTLGELALFYSIAPVALIAGSLLPHLKGHNPIEAARLGAAILSGPYVESFQDIYTALDQQGGAVCVHDADTIARVVSRYWSDEELRGREVAQAQGALAHGEHILHETMHALETLLRTRTRDTEGGFRAPA